MIERAGIDEQCHGCVQTFAVTDPTVRVAWTARDGDLVKRGQVFGTLAGSALSILTGERVALNFLQRMSGIATATAAMVAAVQARCPFTALNLKSNAGSR